MGLIVNIHTGNITKLLQLLKVLISTNSYVNLYQLAWW